MISTLETSCAKSATSAAFVRIVKRTSIGISLTTVNEVAQRSGAISPKPVLKSKNAKTPKGIAHDGLSTNGVQKPSMAISGKHDDASQPHLRMVHSFARRSVRNVASVVKQKPIMTTIPNHSTFVGCASRVTA